MKYAFGSILSLSLLAVSALAFDDPIPGAPQAESLEPRIGKAGTVLNIKGRSLSKSTVDEVYLTDHRFDMKVKVLEQSDTELKIRVPPFVKPGRLQLLLLTSGKNPVFLEQPFYVQIDDGEDTTPAAAPVEVTKNAKPKTVEIASTSKSIPVPAAPAPAPMTSAAAPKHQEEKKEKSNKKKESAPTEVAQNRTPAGAQAFAAKNEAPTPAAVPAAQPPTQQQAPVAAPPVVQNKPVETPAVQPPVQQPQLQQVQQPEGTTLSQARQNQANEVVPQGAENQTNITPAQVIRRSRVAYPASAQTSKIEGAVELIAVVKADGHVKEVKVVKGSPYLVPAAISAVREWLYEPARIGNRAVESEVSVILNFKRTQ
jgi:TonB family protein